MSNLAQLAFLNTRISIYAGKLQPPGSLQPFIESADPVPSDYLEAIGLDLREQEHALSASALEQELMNALIEDAEYIMHAIPAVMRKLLFQWMQRFEMMNLKSLIRCKLTNCSSERARDFLLDIKGFGRLPLEQLLHAEDIDEFMRTLALRDAVLAQKIRAHIGGAEQLFMLEAAMDYHFYAGLLDSCEQLPGRERESVRRLIGRIIDQVNLVWILRYRIAYELQPPHTYFMLVRTGLQLDRHQLAQLAALSDFDAIRKRLPCEYGDCLRDAQSLQCVEFRIMRINLDYARRLLRQEQFHFVRALAYLYLRERQLQEVHQVIKGKLLGFSPQLIRQALEGEAA
ncbi:MAG: V-type ATPase subunit [Gammaproteobacteria bacterium]|jgi:V/A-type H+/Na+-transporting ATPase subunit C